MNRIYRAQRVTDYLNGQECHFRSKLEHRYALYLDILMGQGEIYDWKYEVLKFPCSNGKTYTPDFDVQKSIGIHEIHETKGPLFPRHVTQIRYLMKEYHSVAFMEYHLIFDGPNKKTEAKPCWRSLTKLQMEYPDIHIHYIGSTLRKLGLK